MSRPPRYTTIAIGLHWLLAAAILTSLVVGNFMSDLPISPLRLKLVNWHKWAGVTILALSLLRLMVSSCTVVMVRSRTSLMEWV